MLSTTGLAPDGAPFQVTQLNNSQGMTVSFMDWGATWLSAQVPLADHTTREVILSCGSPERYIAQSAYLGATVGRYANRIRNAFLTRINRQLIRNQGMHQLHGGARGFSHQRWKTISSTQQSIHYQLHSPDGDQGFPGTLTVDLQITLGEDNSLSLKFTALTDQLTPLSLTNHAYFNLDAHHGDVRQHQLQLNASRFQPVDSEGLPEGATLPVNQTHFDFRVSKRLSKDFLKDEFQQKVGGYDHAFVIDTPNPKGLPAACLTSTDGKLKLVLNSSEPALQVYSGNFLAGIPSVQGEYQNYQGVALEPGYLPDSANQSDACWLNAGETREINIRYQFISA
jgi:aldose 1-epimerase